MSLVLTEGLPLVPIHLRDSVPVLWALIFVPIQSHLPLAPFFSPHSLLPSPLLQTRMYVPVSICKAVRM